MGVSSSDYLLDHITELIRDSAGCIFDATGGNPNVSLEVGIAHTIPVDFILTIKTRKPRTVNPEIDKPAKELRPIINDLQGKNRIEYKTYDSLKLQLETRYFARLPFFKRWKNFKSENKDMAQYAVSLFGDLRSSGRSTTARLGASIEGSGFTTTDVLNALQSHKLVSVRRGFSGGVFYPAK